MLVSTKKTLVAVASIGITVSELQSTQSYIFLESAALLFPRSCYWCVSCCRLPPSVLGNHLVDQQTCWKTTPFFPFKVYIFALYDISHSNTYMDIKTWTLKVIFCDVVKSTTRIFLFLPLEFCWALGFCWFLGFLIFFLIFDFWDFVDFLLCL